MCFIRTVYLCVACAGISVCLYLWLCLYPVHGCVCQGFSYVSITATQCYMCLAWIYYPFSMHFECQIAIITFCLPNVSIAKKKKIQQTYKRPRIGCQRKVIIVKWNSVLFTQSHWTTVWIRVNSANNSRAVQGTMPNDNRKSHQTERHRIHHSASKCQRFHERKIRDY